MKNRYYWMAAIGVGLTLGGVYLAWGIGAAVVCGLISAMSYANGLLDGRIDALRERLAELRGAK